MTDSDLDPQAFLKTVRDLSDKRQREDNERFEKLEAQILQDRTARLERKLERERSSSPEKTPQSVRAHNDQSARNSSTPPRSDTGSPMRELDRSDSIRSLQSDRDFNSVTNRSPSPSKPASPSAAMPSRTNTMSWQRRPQSGVRSRPLSLLAAENASRTAGDGGADSRPSSRDELTQQDVVRSLSQKDPSWFRQTPDRGQGSAAYRKTRDDNVTASTASDRRQLPGLQVDDLGKLVSQQTNSSVARPSSPACLSPKRELPTMQEEGETSSASASLHAPPTDRGRATTPEVERAAFGRTVPGLSSRASVTDRPSSPTKGMGGFVQSAMMKRTDSVSKRWSNQPPGLARQDSTASIRSGFGSVRNNLGNSYSMPKLDHQRNSAEPTSRPGSSHSTISAISNLPSLERPSVEPPARQAGSFHNRSKSHASLRDNTSTATELPPTFSPPLSPSKRWSPTKSSWLESALSRPESPTKQLVPQSSQPSWMTELSKSKQQRESVASTFSQDDHVVEMGTALVQSMQSVKVTNKQTTNGTKDSSTTPAKRVLTPPAKEKPLRLKGKTSQEILRESPNRPAIAITEEVQKPTAANATLPGSEQGPGSSAVLPKEPKITSPNANFRPNPRVRSESSEQDHGSKPEFLNAFGKLKKTTTQNYVAPDVLKNNILRGKAGLAMTGGPQKTERKDEFKESILAKKAEWKDKPVSSNFKSPQKQPVPAPTPEALQVKKGLQRSGSSDLSSTPHDSRRNITPEALARHKTLRGKPAVPSTLNKMSETPVSAPLSRKASDTTSLPKSTTKSELEPAVKAIPSGQVPTHREPIIPVATSNVKSNKLADKFNPALAGLLARGPPPQANTKTAEVNEKVASTTKATSSSEEQKGGNLTHMTKARARGPKRRKPQSTITSELPQQSIAEPTAVPTETVPRTRSPASTTRVAVQSRPKSIAVRTLSADLSEKARDNVKPPTPTKSASLPLQTNAPASTRSSAAASTNAKSSPPSASPLLLASKSSMESKTNSPVTLTLHERATDEAQPSRTEEDKENTHSFPSVKSAASKWGKVDTTRTTTSRADPIKLPSSADDEAAMKSAGLLSNSPLRYQMTRPDGLGISIKAKESPNTDRCPISPPSSGGLPPKPAKSSRVVSQTLTEAPGLEDDGPSPATPKAARDPQNDVEVQLENFFGRIPVISAQPEYDTQAMLDGQPSPAGKTLRKTIQMLSENGKLMGLPTEREYILFSSTMYIVTHVFGTQSGQRRTEVYLWAGTNVSPAAIEDVQIFANRIAKDVAAGSRVIPPVVLVRQGKEPASFFQALGGIVITRRGSHADAATRPYMLRCHPHLGHIAFDEVDLDAAELLPTFAHIVVNPVTIQDTRAWLWTSPSCSAETVGSARLISMDLSSQDVSEVSCGGESAAFMSLFATKTEISSRGGGTLPSISERTPARLFRIDAAPPRRASSSFFGFFSKRPSSPSPVTRPTSSASNRSLTTSPAGEGPLTTIAEISPFTQDDFEPENVYVLDVGSTILVIPGPLLASAATQSVKGKDSDGHDAKMWEHMFAQACLFANDYAMLAAGLQDRPRVPLTNVALGGLGRHNEVVFRGWDDRRGLWGAAGLMAGRRSAGPAGGEEIMIDVGAILDCCAR